jgi:ribosomal protein L7Ae-like RNA K-turn-binding protein
MKNSKAESYFGFAVKSRSVLFGVDNIVTGKKVYLILLCDQISQNSSKKVIKYATEKNVKIITLNKEDMFNITKRETCLAAGVTNESLSGAIENALSNIGGNNA